MQKEYSSKVKALERLSILESKALNAFLVYETAKDCKELCHVFADDLNRKIDSFRTELSRLVSDGLLSQEEETLLYNLFVIRERLIGRVSINFITNMEDVKK